MWTDHQHFFHVGNCRASCESAYSATNSGIHGLTKALAKELAPSNIQVNAIACGVIDTEMNARLNEEERAALAEEIPSGRFSSPEEVAELVLLLCSSSEWMAALSDKAVIHFHRSGHFYKMYFI